MTLFAIIEPGQGWEYVWAAYGITWTVLLLYGVSLWLRWKSGPSGGDVT